MAIRPLVRRTRAVLTRLQKIYRDKAMVDFGRAEDTLIATLLSARTRDEQVIAAYPGLRSAFPGLRDLADAPVEAAGRYRRPCGRDRFAADAGTRKAAAPGVRLPSCTSISPVRPRAGGCS